MRPTLARTAAAGVLALAALTTLPASAQEEAASAVAYVNPDTGKPTANGDVEPGSSCENADQQDTQVITTSATEATGNVHVDACLKDASGAALDTQASFDVSGVGEVFKCPDADMGGPKTSTKTETRCTHSGFESANSEYHIRLTSSEGGTQTITFCADPQGDGCADASVTSTATITWAPRGGVATGTAAVEDPTGPTSPAVMAAAALVLLAGAGVARRARA
jgi:hypothetical protein